MSQVCLHLNRDCQRLNVIQRKSILTAGLSVLKNGEPAVFFFGMALYLKCDVYHRNYLYFLVNYHKNMVQSRKEKENE